MTILIGQRGSKAFAKVQNKKLKIAATDLRLKLNVTNCFFQYEDSEKQKLIEEVHALITGKDQKVNRLFSFLKNHRKIVNQFLIFPTDLDNMLPEFII